MMEERHIELMQGEIDGTNSPAQSRELAKIVAADTEARHALDQLRAVVSVLDKAEAIDPPAHLKKAIMTSLDPQRYATDRQGSAPALMGWRFSLRFAMAFAAGVVVGLGLFVFGLHLQGPSRQESLQEFYGTIQKDLSDIPGEKRFFPMSGKGLEGKVTVLDTGKKLIAMIELDKAGSVDLVFEYPGEVRLELLRFLSGARGEVRIAPTELSLSNTSEGALLVAFERSGAGRAEITLRAAAEGRTLWRRNITGR